MNAFVSAIRLLLFGAFFFGAAAFFAAAKDADGAGLSPFFGDWLYEGKAFGLPATSTMTWTPVLNDRFVSLDYRIVMKGPDGTESVFEAHAFYQSAGDGAYRAVWVDNTGDLHPIAATLTGSELIAHWGTAGAKQGRSHYIAKSPTAVEVVDFILTPAGWKEFNRADFVKK